MNATFLDDVKANVPRRGPSCTMCIAMARLEPELRAEIQAVLDMPKEECPTTAIEKALESRGIQVANGAVGRHRNGRCNRGA